MRFIDVTLMALAFGTIWVVVVVVSPVRTCTWCKGTRRALRHRTRGRAGACPRCRATGKHPRLGAMVVHRWRQTVIEERRRRREERS